MENKREELEIISEESKNEEFKIKYPLYRECFKNAFFSILSNLYMQDNYKKKFRNDEAFRYSFSRLPDNANNIYAFLGGRGSGKTTAINEFGRNLKELPKKTKWMIEAEDALNSKQDDKRQEFIVLDTIDASLLTDKEDFVELVLAQLFAIVEKERNKSAFYSRQQNSNYVTQLIDAFTRAYNSYRNISREEAGRELGDSVTYILKNMPSGSNARWAISQLLTCFFEFIEEREGESESRRRRAERYLVITIDDLDLNIKYGYKLLEQVHKYLADPRIIVLIAADYGQLSHVCEYYFKNQYSQNQEQANRDSAIELSREYLLKAIPIPNRIYMPDSREFEKKYVKVIGDSTSPRDVKSFVMNKVVEKLGIYYDMNGTKRHFAVPKTVRELVNYNDFLCSLNSIEWQKGEVSKGQMNQYDLNHARMNQDITSRMAYQLLTHEQQRVFQRLIDKNIINRAKYTVNLCRNWREKTYEDKTDTGKYYYADLIEELYTLGRNDYRDKELVHCIIAFLTSEMTREYYNFQAIGTKNENNSKKRLKSFLGDSFGNEWFSEMVPMAEFDSEKGIIDKWGYIKKAQSNLWTLKSEFNVNEQCESPSEGEIIYKLIDNLKENKYFEIIGILMLFLSGYGISDGHVRLPEMRFEITETAYAEKEGGGEKKWGYEITFATNSTTFDIFGFIGKEWDNTQINEISNKIVEKIKKGVGKFVHEKSEIQENEQMKDIYTQLENTVKEQLGKWIGDNFLAFPFYSLDMSYNVLKRARKKGISMGRQVKLEQIYDTMKRVYGYIAAELYLEEKEYNKNEIKGLKWYEKFVNSSFIKNFGISYSEEMRGIYELEDIPGTMTEEMQNQLKNIIKTMIIPGEKDDTPN